MVFEYYPETDTLYTKLIDGVSTEDCTRGCAGLWWAQSCYWNWNWGCQQVCWYVESGAKSPSCCESGSERESRC